MRIDAEVSWVSSIYRHIFGILVLLVTFALIASVYITWYQNSVSRHQSHINYHHLNSALHFYKAQGALHQQQMDLFERSLKAKTDTRLPAKHTSLALTPSINSSNYLIRQEIQAAMELHRTFADERFNSLNAKLTRQLTKYWSSSHDLLENGAGFVQAIADIDRLLVTLDQLIRLHSIERDDDIVELEAFREFHNPLFYFLALGALSVGILLIIRSIKAIRVVISKQKQAEDKIKSLAFYDSLTGLPNRALSLDRLSQVLREARRDKNKFALLFLDLDDFKKVNDTLGHDAGDNLLVQISQRLKSHIRSSDIVGRLGGDEFVIIFSKVVDEAEVSLVVQKLFDQISQVFKIKDDEVIVTSSAGISFYPDDGSDVSELLRKADSAMYNAKNLGRNTFSFYTEAMNSEVSRRLAIEAQLHGALDRGEFKVVYQPQIDLVGNRVVGAEALLRWHNQALGDVPPDEFIPIAEQTGLIVSIGKYVLTEALGFLTRWQNLYDSDFRIAINLSPRQFRDQQLVGTIQKAIQESGIEYHHLELEITEGVLLSDQKYVVQALNELSNMGVRIAMDDFGTGYSSLNYLRSYPFDLVKIDRSFIMDITTCSSDRALVDAAISMAHSLDLEVMAEGVETQEQLTLLQELGCDLAQGYFFAKPMPEKELMLKQRNNKSTKFSQGLASIG